MIAVPLADDRLRFLLAGGWNTVFGFVVFSALHALLHEHLAPWAIILASYAIALPQSFAVQKHLVFRSDGSARRQWRRFAAASTLIFAANLVLVPLVIATTGWHAVAVQAGFVAATTLASYLAHRHYSFA
jgi:putative flippase GtrA